MASCTSSDIIDGCFDSKQYGQAKLQPRLVTRVRERILVSNRLSRYLSAKNRSSSKSAVISIRPLMSSAIRHGEQVSTS
jgi:hypothetical protein